jgi:uncharacterized Zn-binding protein involved in type VI secretion
MPAVVRSQVDLHIGHASPTPNPFHQTQYKGGSTNVFVNNRKSIRIGDKTGCGDPAAAGSANVFVNGKPIHRKGDATSGHGSWVANAAASGSGNVFANG